ncbi:DUF1854 domain-containing protein [Nitrosovibrio sp. Nv17]|uniref:cyanophycin metabolism-associated DUF1854 family protein n=1 Tax=Nitrosovibrio sp. Nv17 TaxID=1855339 RepID=UPI000930AD9E|nr:DUF1854 domain-containing protein [Nitrosovibrio sp. Nv17]
MSAGMGYELSRDAFGRLILTDAEGGLHVGVACVRAFPVTAPGSGIALVDRQGHELAWIDRLSRLPEALHGLVEADLAEREFIPEIIRILGVSSFVTPNVWSVETDRGPTSFILRGEESIRRLSIPSLLIVDSHGIQFLVRDSEALDSFSRRVLDRFL